MDNIADDLDEEQLSQISAYVSDGYEIDKESRAEWDETLQKVYKLISPAVEEKNIPWPKAANIKYPMIMGGCMQFNARTVPQIIQDDKVVNVKEIGTSAFPGQREDRSERISNHMSYQLLKQQKNWKSDKIR